MLSDPDRSAYMQAIKREAYQRKRMLPPGPEPQLGARGQRQERRQRAHE